MSRRASYKDWLDKDSLLLIEGWARRGLSNEQIANNIGVARQTFQSWLNKHADISDAVKRGKAPVDIEVENALLKRALGYEYQETKTITKIDEYGNQQILGHEVYKKHQAPDVGAVIFWLKNRVPDYWSNKETAEKEKISQDIELAKLEAEKIQLEIDKINEQKAETSEAIIIVDEWAIEDDSNENENKED